MLMTQKTVLLLLSLLVIPGALLAKDEPVKSASDLSVSLEAYKKVTMSNDVDGILSFVYAPMFQLVPREQLKTLLTQMYSNGNAPVIKAIDYTQIGPIQAYSKGAFSIVNYAMEMDLPRPGDATPDIDKAVISMMKSQLGPDAKIAIDTEKNLVNIKKSSVMLAINEDQAGWKVLEKDKIEMLKKGNILPKDLIEKLK